MKLFTSRVLLHVLFYCIVILITSRCDKFETAKHQTKQTQPTLNDEELRRLILLDTSFVYPLASATNDAKLIAIEFDKKDKISHTPRSIKEVLTVNKPDQIVAQQSKKSQPVAGRIEDVPEVYVFNFNDNRGYAIISADER